MTIRSFSPTLSRYSPEAGVGRAEGLRDRKRSFEAWRRTPDVVFAVAGRPRRLDGEGTCHRTTIRAWHRRVVEAVERLGHVADALHPLVRVLPNDLDVLEVLLWASIWTSLFRSTFTRPSIMA